MSGNLGNLDLLFPDTCSRRVSAKMLPELKMRYLSAGKSTPYVFYGCKWRPRGVRGATDVRRSLQCREIWEIWISCFRTPVVGELAQVGGCDLKWAVSQRLSRHHILFMAAKGAPGVPGGRQIAVGACNVGKLGKFGYPVSGHL